MDRSLLKESVHINLRILLGYKEVMWTSEKISSKQILAWIIHGTTATTAEICVVTVF